MGDRTRGAELGIAGSDGFLRAVGGLVVVGAAALAVVGMVGASPAESVLEQVSGGVALGALLAAPGALVLVGLRDRPALLLPASVALVPLSFLSLAGVTLPLLIPAVMVAVGYGRRSSAMAARGHREAHPLLAALAVVVLLAAAGTALFVHADPRSYHTPTESGSTSDVVTPLEAAVSLLLIAGAFAAGWVLSSPTAPAPRGGDAASDTAERPAP